MRSEVHVKTSSVYEGVLGRGRVVGVSARAEFCESGGVVWRQRARRRLWRRLSRRRWRKRFVVCEPGAIDYSGSANRYLLVPDCGPQDRAAEFACQFHWSDIQLDPTASTGVRMTLASTSLLVNDNERQLVGLSSAFDQAHPKRGLRFDPEGARVGQAGQIFVSDEYGPSICEFSSSGKLARRFKIPAKFRPTKLSADPAGENSTNKTGRQVNGGFEGLALTPDGKKLFAFTQRPLLQDSQPNAEDPEKRLGIYN